MLPRVTPSSRFFLLLLALPLLFRCADIQNQVKSLPTRAGGLATQKAEEKIEAKIGLRDELAQRAMTGDEKKRAARARAIFERPGYQPIEVYIPRDAGRARYLKNYRDAMAAVKGKKTVTDAELLRIARSMLPFLRFLAAAQDGPNTLTVFPGERRAATFQAYCMDHHAPAPGQGERLQLRPSSTLIDPEGRQIYAALMAYSARHPGAHFAVQNLVWGLRHANEQPPFIQQLSPEQRTLLNAARPGLAEQWGPYLARQQARGQLTRAKREAYEYFLGRVQQQLGHPLPRPTASGYSATDVRTTLQALAQMTPEGQQTPDSEFTLLAPNVAARALDHSGYSSADVEIVNAGCDPFTFHGEDYAGVSTRFSQRLALGGVLTIEPLSAHLPAGYVFHAPWAGDVAFAGLGAQVERSAAARTLSQAGIFLGRALVRLPAPLRAVAILLAPEEAAVIGAVAVGATAGTYLGHLILDTIHTQDEIEGKRPATAAAGAAVGTAVSTIAANCPPPGGPEDPLDPETRERVNRTLERIERGENRYPKDGDVWENREGLLPKKGGGYYHEYTVDPKPGLFRGSERLIKGDSGEIYYTPDHYKTFVRIR